jgi:hypothetical protein
MSGQANADEEITSVVSNDNNVDIFFIDLSF